MPHGGYSKRGRNTSSHRTGVIKKPPKSKPKPTSLKNQIRSIERLLRKDLPSEIREAQQTKLDGLKKQQDLHNRLAIERKIFLRDRKIKFFERRKIERRMRRLEKNLRSSSGQAQEKEISEELAHLKEDLEYVRFFPKTEKYLSLFCGDDNDLVDKRNKLRKQIKENIIAAAASGKDLEETGSEDDGLADLSDDDFFLSGTSSDEADADDELTDLSAREQASSASGKAASGISSDERNQKQKSARSLMPPPRPRKPLARRNISTSSNASNSRVSISDNRGSSNSQTGQSSNMSSNSDAPKRRRKRRPKKKRQ